MALVSKPYTFTVGATIIAAQHNSNFDTLYNDYNGNITDANLSGSFSLDQAKIGNISTYGKVSGSVLTQLNTINGSAGTIPITNLPTGTSANQLVVMATGPKLPAVDGSALTGLVDVNASGSTATSDQSLPASYALLDGMTNTQTCVGTKLLILFNAVYHTGFSGSGGTLIRFKVDGNVVWTQSRNFTGGGNTADMNFFSPCMYLAGGLTAGSHTVTVESQSGNTTDPHIFDRNLIVIDLP